MVEIWKQIPSFEGMYEASSLGRIRSVPRTVKYTGGSDRVLQGKVLKVHLRFRDGYARVDFCVNGVRIPIPVHQAVALTFRGPCPLGQEIRHKNGKQSNNRATNLSYGTKVQNAADKIRHGTTNRGERCGTSKLTKRQIKKIRLSSERSSVIAGQYGVSARHIRKIRSGAAWGWL